MKDPEAKDLLHWCRGPYMACKEKDK